MMMEQQVYAQALLLTGQLEGKQAELLKVLCRAAASSLEARLKEGITPESCKGAFVAAASLYALADLTAVDDSTQVQEFRAGDLTVKKSGKDGASGAPALQRQAEALMKPYVKDSFAFLGV